VASLPPPSPLQSGLIAFSFGSVWRLQEEQRSTTLLFFFAPARRHGLLLLCCRTKGATLRFFFFFVARVKEALFPFPSSGATTLVFLLFLAPVKYIYVDKHPFVVFPPVGTSQLSVFFVFTDACKVNLPRWPPPLFPRTCALSFSFRSCDAFFFPFHYSGRFSNPDGGKG